MEHETNLSNEVISFWRTTLADVLVCLPPPPVMKETCFNEQAAGKKEMLIQELLRYLLSSLQQHTKIDAGRRDEVRLEVQSVLEDCHAKLFSATFLSEQQVSPSNEDSNKIALSVILMFVSVVKLQHQGSLYHTLLHLDHDRQQALHTVFEALMDNGSLNRESLFMQLRSIATSAVGDKRLETPKLDSSFTFSPTSSSATQVPPAVVITSPISRMVNKYQHIAETQSKLTLSTKFELDQEQEKSWELLEKLKRSQWENNQLKLDLQATKKELMAASEANEVSELKSQISRLECELKKRPKHKLHQDCMDANSVSRLLEEQTVELKSMLEQKDSVVTDLLLQIESLQTQIGILKGEKVELKETIQGFQEETLELKNIISELKEHKQQDTSECLYLGTDVELASNFLCADLKEANEKLQSKSDQLDQEHLDLHRQLEEMKKDRDGLKEKYQKRMKDFADQVNKKYQKKVKECQAHFQKELGKSKSDLQKSASEQQKLLDENGALLLQVKEVSDMAEKERIAVEVVMKKNELSKALLERSLKKSTATSSSLSIVDATPINKITLAPLADNTEYVKKSEQKGQKQDTFTFKQPIATAATNTSPPGRIRNAQSTLPFPRRPPVGSGPLFTMDDEPGEAFSSSFLSDMKLGKCAAPRGIGRLSELARRNTLVPAHLQSSYPAETQFFSCSSFAESDLLRGSIQPDVKALAEQTSLLAVNSPAANTRSRHLSRKPPILNDMTQRIPSAAARAVRKRRSITTPAENQAASMFAKRSKKERPQGTSSSRSGPPTPAMKGKRNHGTSTLEDANINDDGNRSHDRTPLLDTTNTSEVSTRSQSHFKIHHQTLKNVLNGAFSHNKRKRYNVKPQV